MNTMDMMEWSNWKNLTETTKRQVLAKVLMYFVSPLKLVTNIQAREFDMGGVKCATFELEIDGYPFIFIPGNNEAILGWDLGVQGLATNTWSQPFPQEQSLKTQQLIKEYGLVTSQQWDHYINLHTTPLRKVAIPPMLVEKYPMPVGSRYIGSLDTITGEFTGQVERFQPIEEEVRHLFAPPKTFEESLSQNLPDQMVIGENFYIELSQEMDCYYVFQTFTDNQRDLQKVLRKNGFTLLTEDQWEYAVGAGTRRLFRWGNELDHDHSYWGRQVRRYLRDENMFGVLVDDRLHRYEITAESFLKLDITEPTGMTLLDFLPMASYYRAPRLIEDNEVLPITDFCYRRAVVVDLDK